MRLAVLGVALLWAPLAVAGGPGKAKRKPKPAPTAEQVKHPFADVAVAKLHVVDTRGEEAVVEDKAGNVVLVRTGDLLGSEAFEVARVSLGCLKLKGPSSELSMCVEVPEVPQT